jgi:hypothetical protein
MPIVNTYYTNDEDKNALVASAQELKEYFASILTCGDIRLKPNEITVRLLSSEPNGMIAPLEIEILAHAFKERVDRQDEICLETRKKIMQLFPDLSDVRIWLVLSELGHSWEE